MIKYTMAFCLCSGLELEELVLSYGKISALNGIYLMGSDSISSVISSY